MANYKINLVDGLRTYIRCITVTNLEVEYIDN